MINGNTYSKFVGTDKLFGIEEPEILGLYRDSSGYILNEKGDIHFALEDESDSLYVKHEIHESDTIYSMVCKMDYKHRTITTEAVSFEVLNFQGTLRTFRHPSPRYVDNLYAEGVGRVFKTYLFTINTKFWLEKRLKEYHIEK